MPKIAPVWEARLYNQAGEGIAIFDEFVALEVNLKRNDYGNFSITFYDDESDDRLRGDFWELDGQVELRRWIPEFFIDGGVVQWVPNFNLFYGFVRQRKRGVDQKGNRVVTYHGVSYEHLLSRRVIAALEGTTRAEKDGPANTVMCEYVDENCGPSAGAHCGKLVGGQWVVHPYGRYFFADYGDKDSCVPADGVMQGFSIEWPYSPSEVTWQGVKSFDNLLDALKEIAETTGVDFQVIKTGPAEYGFSTAENFGFGSDRTSVGVDPTTGKNAAGYSPVVFSLEQDNISAINEDFDRMAESTRVFVLGKGEMSTKSILPWDYREETEASPWNTIEKSVSSSDSDFIYQLKWSGNEALQDGLYNHIITIDSRQTEMYLFQYHYSLGDRVTVNFEEFTQHFRIIGVSIRWDKSGVEDISLDLQAPVVSITGQFSGPGPR